MSSEKARILITSAIPYINGIKHLGNLIGSQLPADLYARYMRARGHDVLFLCATDEHGTPAELAAAMVQARASGHGVTADAFAAPGSVAAAYAVQSAQIAALSPRLGPVAAWKTGRAGSWTGISPASQACPRP
jgi:leucyl-tRNA synthetase